MVNLFSVKSLKGSVKMFGVDLPFAILLGGIVMLKSLLPMFTNALMIFLVAVWLFARGWLANILWGWS